jgi:uncharacterized damage-inducible protein DinB
LQITFQVDINKESKSGKFASMSTSNLPEVWMRGPLPNVPPLLQPVAHALLQASEELNDILQDFPQEKLWLKPSGLASVGFHLQHIAGVLDRLFTYARGEQLTPEQLQYLLQEGIEPQPEISVEELLSRVDHRIQASIESLNQFAETTLSEERFVGRKRLPSTVIGLLFHAAEHTMRHLGQLLVTARVLQN